MSKTISQDFIELSVAGFELGKTYTDGQLVVSSNTPQWALEPTDITVSSPDSNLHHLDYGSHDHGHIAHGHDNHDAREQHYHEDKQKEGINPVSAKDLLEAEKIDNHGYRPVVIKFSEMLKTPGLLGRVLLYPDGKSGFVPVVIMPDTSNPGRGVKFVKFNEPYDPVAGIDEGKILALSFETMAKEQAGFGAHGKGAFEGGHFTVAALASVNTATADFMNQQKHSGTHQIIGGSVVTDLSRNRIVTSDLPRPIVRTYDTKTMPPNSAVTLYWMDTMVDDKGVALRANHQDASRILTGNMIHVLGSGGLDKVSQFVMLASQDQ